MATAESTEATWTARIDHDHLHQYLSAVNELVDECRLHVDEDGIRTCANDPANVAIVEAELSADAFETYETDGTDIGINVTRLRDVLENFDAPETVELSYRKDRRKLTLSAGAFSYTYACINPDSIRQDAEFPEMDLAAAVEIGADRLSAALEYIEGFTDKVKVGYDPADGEFYIRGEGSTDDAEFRVCRQDLEYVSKPGDAHSLFHVDYATDIADAPPEGATVRLEVGQEFPMYTEFDIAPMDGPGTGYHGEVRFMQAPRIMSD